jgi:hypothetical protein
METSRPRGLGATIRFIVLPVAIGIPLVGYLWETANQVLTGQVDATRIAISAPLLVVFVLLLRWLARGVVAFDRGSRPSTEDRP